MSGKRISLYVNHKVDESLVLVSRRMGISKSILVSKLLEVPLQDLIELLAHVPEKPSGADIIRFKGKSIDLVNKRVDEMRGVLKDSEHE